MDEALRLSENINRYERLTKIKPSSLIYSVLLFFLGTVFGLSLTSPPRRPQLRKLSPEEVHIYKKHPRRPDLQLFVLHAFRRNRLGTRLVERIIQKEGLLNRQVTVHPETSVAEAFFDNCGFDR